MKASPIDPRFIRNVLIKAALLFVAANALFAAVNPLPALGQLSAYNALFPGRPRFPFGETPEKAYNFSLFNLEAMFASHELVGVRKLPDEYRVLLIGDSSVWGTLLKPDETLAGYLNAGGYTTRAGRRVRAFNLGYPTMSLTKDVMVLTRAQRYQPDLIVWLMTLESFPRNKQLSSPIVQQNAATVRQLIADYGLHLDPGDPNLAEPSFLERTLVGQRRNLADLLRLQLYGVPWAATGLDQFYPDTYTPRAEDLEPELNYYDFQPPKFPGDALAFEVLEAGLRAAGDAPVLLVNEPMFISHGQNSDIRYNFYYPKWAYDEWRRAWVEQARSNGWTYRDLWDSIAPGEFTNSAVHLTSLGSSQLAAQIGPMIVELAGQ